MYGRLPVQAKVQWDALKGVIQPYYTVKTCNELCFITDLTHAHVCAAAYIPGKSGYCKGRQIEMTFIQARNRKSFIVYAGNPLHRIGIVEEITCRSSQWLPKPYADLWIPL